MKHRITLDTKEVSEDFTGVNIRNETPNNIEYTYFDHYENGGLKRQSIYTAEGVKALLTLGRENMDLLHVKAEEIFNS